VKEEMWLRIWHVNAASANIKENDDKAYKRKASGNNQIKSKAAMKNENVKHGVAKIKKAAAK